MSRAFVFPGQGAQVVGMGRDLAEAYPAAKAVFEEVDAALGEKLSAVIWEGELEDLTLTANAQPALMATSIAAVRALEAEGVGIGGAAFVAGHSLGEYSALCAAGAISSPTPRGCCGCAARRCRRRFRWASARWRRSWGSTSPRSEAWRRRRRRAGSARRRTTTIRRRWWSRGTRPRSSGRWRSPGRGARSGRCCCRCARPFHCALMRPAAEAMAAALAGVAIEPPAVPLVANVRAAAVRGSRGDPAAAGGAGNRPGALARER